MNGGTCQDLGDGTIKCNCKPGYGGSVCQTSMYQHMKIVGTLLPRLQRNFLYPRYKLLNYSGF